MGGLYIHKPTVIQNICKTVVCHSNEGSKCTVLIKNIIN